MRAAARQPDLDDLPGADVEPQPGLHRSARRSARGCACTSGSAAPTAMKRAPRAARGGADPRPRGAAPAVPAPALRRPAPAGDDRDGARQPPRRADRRRADHRPRRDGAGADPAPDRRPQGALRHGRGADHPRPDRGPAVRRLRLRHAARRGARVTARPSEIFTAPAAPLHQAPARLRAQGRRQPLRRRRRDRARRATTSASPSRCAEAAPSAAPTTTCRRVDGLVARPQARRDPRHRRRVRARARPPSAWR